MGSGHTTAPLLPGGAGNSSPRRRRWVVVVLGLIAAAAVIATVGPWGPVEPLAGLVGGPCGDSLAAPMARGVKEGVSDKSSGVHMLGVDPCGFPWTNNMLAWQRTAFHFQPQMNWMNDPNGPMFYKGWYHLFYQWNPDSAVWGNITWGHAVSRDLLRWLHLPQAMVADQWYDANGVFSGSATFLPGGRIVMVYTGSTNTSAQVQNIAFPADPTDPLLLSWVKSESNPVLLPPPGVGEKDFRDPTTAWLDPLSEGSNWLFTIGSKDDSRGSHTGVALVYQTKDFVQYDRLPGVLHAVPRTGMWECVDFYPISTVSSASDGETVNGLDTSVAPGPGVKHVLKASMDDERHDYYAIGTYDPEQNEFVPDEPEQDVGIGRRYDWGKYYASKTFYDQNKKRRVMWAWIGETDSENADLHKGWASVQAIPRTVQFDQKTRNSLLLWPVEEVETLRMSHRSFSGIRIDSGSVFPIDVQSAVQLDIEVEFEIEATALSSTLEADVGYNCSTSGGSTSRGMLGPFGVLVLADQDFSEQTAAYFYVSRGVDGNLGTHFCHDELRSSKATDIVKRVVGSTVPVLNGERLSLRILVDHSIVESFAQGGRTCITSRVYPTDAIYGKARVFLFNNATNAHVTANSLKIWEMNSTFIHQYPIKS